MTLTVELGKDSGELVDTNNAQDVFVRDVPNATTRRFSVSSSGTQATGGASSNPDVSGDGNLIVYESFANNLIGSDMNGQRDIFQTFSPQDRFIRADSNGDGIINVSDSIWTFNWLNGGLPPPCHDAADFNDDGMINLTDGIATSEFLFNGGGPPACPFTCTATLSCCGRDPTGDGLPCGQALANCTQFASNGSCSICQ